MSDLVSKTEAIPVILVTGPSGAGRSSAIKFLEDLGHEAIDNIPLGLLPRLLHGPDQIRPLALGIDIRNRDFSVAGLIELAEQLSGMGHVRLNILYLDCRPDILLTRYSETRRRHPLAPNEAPEIGVAREIDLLAPVLEMADTLIETSELNIHGLRAEIERHFADPDAQRLAVAIQSFSYRRGLPRAIDTVFDCRFLSNPHWQAELRELDGRDSRVQAYVQDDLAFQPFLDRVLDLTNFLLPAYTREGKSHLSIGFGCTGGQHRSVTVAETLAKALADGGRAVSIRHRELERRRRNEGPI